MQIDIDELERITIFLLDKFKKVEGSKIEIKGDYYWDIASEEIYNPYAEPQNISLGQLDDDWKVLKQLLKSEDSVPYDLKRIGAIFTALAYENPMF